MFRELKFHTNKTVKYCQQCARDRSYRRAFDIDDTHNRINTDLPSHKQKVCCHTCRQQERKRQPCGCYVCVSTRYPKTRNTKLHRLEVRDNIVNY